MLYTAPQAFSFCRFGWKRNSCKIILTLLWNSSLVIVRILLFFFLDKMKQDTEFGRRQSSISQPVKGQVFGAIQYWAISSLLCVDCRVDVWFSILENRSPFLAVCLEVLLSSFVGFFFLTEVPSKVQEFCDFRMPQWGCSLGGGNHSHTVHSQSQCLISMHFSLGGHFFLYVCGNGKKKKCCVAFENVGILHFKWKYQIAVFHMSKVNFFSASN